MSYITLKEDGNHLLIEKKSEFIGFAKRVTEESEALEIIKEERKRYPDARHVVYAYTIGENPPVIRYSDDGEPKGTGGLPLLSILEKNGLKDTVLTVTRIFGGILLGASGLTRAYSQTGAETINSAKKMEVVTSEVITITLPYEVHGKLGGTFTKDKLQIIEERYTDIVEVDVLLEQIKVQGFIEEYTNLSQGKAIFSVKEELETFKDDDGFLSNID